MIEKDMVRLSYQNFSFSKLGDDSHILKYFYLN